MSDLLLGKRLNARIPKISKPSLFSPKIIFSGLNTTGKRTLNTNQMKHESQDICQCPQRMKACPLCVFTCHYLGFNSDYGSPSGARGQELLVSFLQSVKVVTVEKDFHLKELIKRL